jgi:malonyl CoA-acyl carrier protein transacylase
LKQRISKLETEARKAASNMRKTIYLKERGVEDVEKLLKDMQEETYINLKASCEQKH